MKSAKELRNYSDFPGFDGLGFGIVSLKTSEPGAVAYANLNCNPDENISIEAFKEIAQQMDGLRSQL